MGYIRSCVQKLSRMSFCLGIFTLSALCSTTTLTAENSNHQNSENLKLGISLETRFWNLVQKQEVEEFSEKLAPIFQGLNVSGVYTRSQQIAGLAQASLISFQIRNPIATRSQDVLVFSYEFVAVGTGLTSGPSITVWKKHEHTWKIVSHSYVPFLI